MVKHVRLVLDDSVYIELMKKKEILNVTWEELLRRGGEL